MRRVALVDFRQESGPGALPASNVDFLLIIRKRIVSDIVVGRCRFRVCFSPSGRSTFGNVGHISPADEIQRIEHVNGSGRTQQCSLELLEVGGMIELPPFERLVADLLQ